MKDSPLFNYSEEDRSIAHSGGSSVKGFFTVNERPFYVEVIRWEKATAVMIKKVVGKGTLGYINTHDLGLLYEEVKEVYIQVINKL